MKLLTFAHRGEAQHFLKVDNYQSVEFSFKGLYKNKENYLLITGEGIESTNIKMEVVLEHIGSEILGVINIGIAGALDNNLELETIHCVNLILKEDESKVFYSSNKRLAQSCLSALNRVHNIDYRNKLTQKAQIVDRELWTIADVCSRYNIPVSSIKLISDYAGKAIDTKRIIQKAKEYSKNLYDFYKSNADI